MAPRVIDPGQSTVVSYPLPAGASNVARVELVGLPPNSMAAGTVSQLAIPAAANDMISTNVALRAPASIVAAQINPASHNVSTCAGQPVNLQLTYTVTDANGANDFRDPRVVQVRGASTVAVTTPSSCTAKLYSATA